MTASLLCLEGECVCVCWQQDTAVELEVARQEVVALRSRLQQLEADTASSSSLEQKQLSLPQVSQYLD